MDWRQKIYSNIFIRNVLASLGAGPKYSVEGIYFTSYFQYKIGPYNNDHFLYFQKKPFALRYKNEIFNKLEGYAGDDIRRYLDFHISAFPNKSDFLEFLHFELSERIKQQPKNGRLSSAWDWVIRKESELTISQAKDFGPTTKDEAFEPEQTSQLDQGGARNFRIAEFSRKLEASVSQILEEAEKGMRELTGSFTTGNVELNSRTHEEKLIQLFIILQQIKAPGRPEQLFKKFSAPDVAAILHLHFLAFRDIKLNTVQRKVAEQTERIRPSQTKIQRLTEALEDFFY